VRRGFGRRYEVEAVRERIEEKVVGVDSMAGPHDEEEEVVSNKS